MGAADGPGTGGICASGDHPAKALDIRTAQNAEGAEKGSAFLCVLCDLCGESTNDDAGPFTRLREDAVKAFGDRRVAPAEDPARIGGREVHTTMAAHTAEGAVPEGAV